MNHIEGRVLSWVENFCHHNNCTVEDVISDHPDDWDVRGAIESLEEKGYIVVEDGVIGFPISKESAKRIAEYSKRIWGME